MGGTRFARCSPVPNDNLLRVSFFFSPPKVLADIIAGEKSVYDDLRLDFHITRTEVFTH